jgi:hypothetical protein
MPKESKKQAKSNQDENVASEEKVVVKKTKEETKEETKADAKKETKADAKKETKADAKKETKADAKKETKADAKKETKADAKKADKVPKKAVKKVQKGGDEDEDEEKQEKKPRSFKAIYVNPAGTVVMQGRYCGAKPKQAACKALSGIYKSFKQKDEEVEGAIQFGVKECTRGSKGKFYWYSGERVTLDEPITLEIKKNTEGKGGKEITYYFNNVVKKEQEDNCKHLLDYKCVDDQEDDDEKQTGGKKTDSKKPVKKAVKKSDAKKSDAKKSDAKKSDVKKADAKKTDVEKTKKVSKK